MDSRLSRGRSRSFEGGSATFLRFSNCVSLNVDELSVSDFRESSGGSSCFYSTNDRIYRRSVLSNNDYSLDR